MPGAASASRGFGRSIASVGAAREEAGRPCPSCTGPSRVVPVGKLVEVSLGAPPAEEFETWSSLGFRPSVCAPYFAIAERVSEAPSWELNRLVHDLLAGPPTQVPALLHNVAAVASRINRDVFSEGESGRASLPEATAELAILLIGVGRWLQAARPPWLPAWQTSAKWYKLAMESVGADARHIVLEALLSLGELAARDHAVANDSWGHALRVRNLMRPAVHELRSDGEPEELAAWSFVLAKLEGCVALGDKSAGTAETAFDLLRLARESFLEAGRDHSAALACLQAGEFASATGEPPEATLDWYRQARGLLDLDKDSGLQSLVRVMLGLANCLLERPAESSRDSVTAGVMYQAQAVSVARFLRARDEVREQFPGASESLEREAYVALFRSYAVRGLDEFIGPFYLECALRGATRLALRDAAANDWAAATGLLVDALAAVGRASAEARLSAVQEAAGRCVLVALELQMQLESREPCWASQLRKALGKSEPRKWRGNTPGRSTPRESATVEGENRAAGCRELGAGCRAPRDRRPASLVAAAVALSQ